MREPREIDLVRAFIGTPAGQKVSGDDMHQVWIAMLNELDADYVHYPCGCKATKGSPVWCPEHGRSL